MPPPSSMNESIVSSPSLSPGAGYARPPSLPLLLPPLPPPMPPPVMRPIPPPTPLQFMLPTLARRLLQPAPVCAASTASAAAAEDDADNHADPVDAATGAASYVDNLKVVSTTVAAPFFDSAAVMPPSHRDALPSSLFLLLSLRRLSGRTAIAVFLFAFLTCPDC